MICGSFFSHGKIENRMETLCQGNIKTNKRVHSIQLASASNQTISFTEAEKADIKPLFSNIIATLGKVEKVHFIFPLSGPGSLHHSLGLPFWCHFLAPDQDPQPALAVCQVWVPEATFLWVGQQLGKICDRPAPFCRISLMRLVNKQAGSENTFSPMHSSWH